MAMTGLAREENSDIVAEINITPLTDIFLVLLIIFMITSSAIVESGGKVNLPSAVKTPAMKSMSTRKRSPRPAWKTPCERCSIPARIRS